MKKDGERLFATCEPTIGIPIVHKLILKGENGKAGECVAWILLQWHLSEPGNGTADLMMMYVEEKNRKKGYAKELLEFLKPLALEIRTDFDASTEVGRQTCIDAGFENFERKDETGKIWHILAWINKDEPKMVYKRCLNMFATMYNKKEETDGKVEIKTPKPPKRITEKKE